MAKVCRCGGITTDDGCNRCGNRKATKDPRNPISSKKKQAYSTKRWEHYSIQFRKTWPLCVHCKRQGKSTAITQGDGVGQVDHIIWCEANSELFWDEENHQGLCRECHGKKTKMEMDGTYTNAMIQRDLEERKKQLEAYAGG